MTPDTTKRLMQLANQLVENLMTVAICAEELRLIVRAQEDDRRKSGNGRADSDQKPAGRPLVDRSTLSLRWEGRTCKLGYTVLFRLADRLSRHPNQYITTEQLQRDVWNGDLRSPDTIRSAIRNLRQRLRKAGMHRLATAIRGRAGHYGLIFDHDS